MYVTSLSQYCNSLSSLALLSIITHALRCTETTHLASSHYNSVHRPVLGYPLQCVCPLCYRLHLFLHYKFAVTGPALIYKATVPKWRHDVSTIDMTSFHTTHTSIIVPAIDLHTRSSRRFFACQPFHVCRFEVCVSFRPPYRSFLRFHVAIWRSNCYTARIYLIVLTPVLHWDLSNPHYLPHEYKSGFIYVFCPSDYLNLLHCVSCRPLTIILVFMSYLSSLSPIRSIAVFSHSLRPTFTFFIFWYNTCPLHVGLYLFNTIPKCFNLVNSQVTLPTVHSLPFCSVLHEHFIHCWLYYITWDIL